MKKMSISNRGMIVKCLFAIHLIVLVMVIPLQVLGNDEEIIDFNFPQDVSKHALDNLDNALNAGDGQLTIDALVRYGLAQSLISKDNVEDIINRLEAVIAKEKQPHIKALLYHLEAMVYEGYRNRYDSYSYRSHNNPTEELPTDISEWNRQQFNKKIAELVDKSFANPDALQQVPVTSLPGIIHCNELGATLVPTLLEFLSYKSIGLMYPLNMNSDTTLVSRIKNRWFKATEGNVPATIFASTNFLATSLNQGIDLNELYQRYRDNEHCAYLLDLIPHKVGEDKQYYDMLQDYVVRFPNSPYTSLVKNLMLEEGIQIVKVDAPAVVSSRDSISVVCTEVKNANSFWINVYRAPEELKDTTLAEEMRLVSQTPVSVQGTIPFSVENVTAKLPPLPYGHYYICPMIENDSIFNQDIRHYQLTYVTDIASFAVGKWGQKGCITAVDIKTGHPVAGVTITGEDTFILGKTGNDGLLKMPYKGKNAKGNDIDYRKNYLASLGPDHFGPPNNYMASIPREDDDDVEYQGHIFTDLGVYRPGETVQWVAIIYQIANNGRTPASGKRIWVGFNDDDYNDIDSLIAITDEYGRIAGSFVVPTDRKNDSFDITLESRFDEDEDEIGYHSVDVSEYKLPTFEITFLDFRRSFAAQQPVKISGKAMSYSGVPIQNSEVRLTLTKEEWAWWRWFSYGVEHADRQLSDTTIVTDQHGRFTIEYTPDIFVDNLSVKPGAGYRSADYIYQVAATITTDAGETQEAFMPFIIGTHRSLQLGARNENTYLNDQPIKLPLEYQTTDKEHPSTDCYWKVTPLAENDFALSGTLNTANPVIDLTSLPSGQYTLNIHTKDAYENDEIKDVSIERIITIYRQDDKTSPVKDCPMWVSSLSKGIDNKQKGHITIGVSTPQAHIYYVAYSGNDIIGEGWLHYDSGLHELSLPVKKAEHDVIIEFHTIYDTKHWQKTLTLANPKQAETMKITATSFRNKLVPGDKEHWTFTLTDKKDMPHPGAMLLDMYDEAVASISDNSWYYPRFDRYFRTPNITCMSLGGTRWSYVTFCPALLKGQNYPLLPELYTYGQSFFDSTPSSDKKVTRTYNEDVSSGLEGRAYGVQLYGSREGELSEVIVAGFSNVDKRLFTGSTSEIIQGVQVSNSMEEESNSHVANLEHIVLRENAVKTALWRPMLTSSDKGQINLEFEVPNANSTWIVQGIAYDKNTVGASWMTEVLTQKPLMVRANMPRFLRQGDKTQLAATVQNATDAVATCDAVIEIFDPRSGGIYDTRKFNLTLDPMGSQVVKIDWEVPDTIPFVGFRIKASDERYGDGEQVMVPVLTTISPVIETEPFFIDAGQNHMEVNVSDSPDDARVTLEYCDNPMWYTAMALPTIYRDAYNTATDATHSLFALMVAQGVAKSQPQIKEAFTLWKQQQKDSTLMSLLHKNQDLKIGNLLASPWMRDADRQTLRMTKLNELLDETSANQEYEKIITALQSLQMEDGGFTWFRYPDCKSSVRTTGSVLELIGEIKHLGYLTDDKRLRDIVNRALNYYDSENLRLLTEAKKHDVTPYYNFASYAYVRSLFNEVKTTDASAEVLKQVLKYMNENWSKNLTLMEKAFYAMTLNRGGYQQTARDIVESIRQHAIVEPSMGMWWDNLQNDFGWWELDKVAYTSVILQAMNEVDPRQEELDQIRKWMLLMKQSNDWGSYSLAADAVFSILSTGSQWTKLNESPLISADEHLIVNSSKINELLGYYRIQLPATTSKVTIDHSKGQPAWGAVYSQFKAPMTQIQEKAIEDMSISKEFYVYAQDGSLYKADTFKVGDKVKVQLVIKVNQDMDYVTLTDERAACFEPVDQLSGYNYEDRTWFYLETKDSQTNTFFDSLGKGTHIIGYDVWVTNPGEFTSGIATIQCQYAPQLSAHSAGKTITVQAK